LLFEPNIPADKYIRTPADTHPHGVFVPEHWSGILLAVEKGLDPVLLSQLSTFADDMVGFSEEKAG
jgi:hypothetical protein